MPLDYQAVRHQVRELGERAPSQAEHYRLLKANVRAALENHAGELQALRDKVFAALSFNSHLRCALPGDEPLDHAAPCPAQPARITLLAADGSQINPDRHASVDFCLVNVGAIQVQPGAGEAPAITVRSQLYYDEQMYTDSGRVTEQLVALRRDLRERQLLAELAAKAEKPLLTLTDGPLELWVGRDEEAEAAEYKKHFEDYLAALRQLHGLGASAAGYIDRPRGDLLVRLLEIADLPLDQLGQAGQRATRRFLGITDADLFHDLLAPGERSAVFGIQSRNANKYPGELSLHFFYLNVGRDERHPYPVRVEIPAWVAASRALLDDLHAVLVQQCQILGTHTYPYLLHRSHEVAVVTQDEKAQVEAMIALEIQNRLGILSETSQKQAAKDVSGRMRMR
jgi:hypothetical protein